MSSIEELAEILFGPPPKPRRWGPPPRRWVSKRSGAPTHCPRCGQLRPHRHYVCGPCWNQLPERAREGLAGHDRTVIPTLQWLYDLAEGVQP